jgi:hypothetical protein
MQSERLLWSASSAAEGIAQCHLQEAVHKFQVSSNLADSDVGDFSRLAK